MHVSIEAFVPLDETYSDGAIPLFYNKSITKEKEYRQTVAKSLFMAALSEFAASCAAKPWFTTYTEECPLTGLKRRRAVYATSDIEEGALVLLPLCAKVGVAKRTAKPFLNTNNLVDQSDNEVVSLTLPAMRSTREDMSDASPVELFWHVPTCAERRQCNVEIVDVEAKVGVGVTIPCITPLASVSWQP